MQGPKSYQAVTPHIYAPKLLIAIKTTALKVTTSSTWLEAVRMSPVE